MKKFLRSRSLVIAVLLAVILALDQITKIIAHGLLVGEPGRDYLGGLLRIEFAKNTGAFLSLGAGMDEHWRFLAFTFAVAIFLTAATYFLFRKNQMNRLTTIGLSLLVAGGVGNLIDRLAYGYVVDFLNVGIGSLRTGIFNIADMAIMLGVVLLFFAGDDGRKASAGKSAVR